MAQHQLVEAGFTETPQHDFHAHAHAEYDAMCGTIVERLIEGSLPPDEAYWWTRIICTEAMTRLSDHCRTGQRHPVACASDCRCGHAAA